MESTTVCASYRAEHFLNLVTRQGKAVRWRIRVAGNEPTTIAGLWPAWEEPDGDESLSFTMLTVNAYEHPLVRRFHKPSDEKRSSYLAKGVR
jgi:putative SOS response-associated peptidase YedK